MKICSLLVLMSLMCFCGLAMGVPTTFPSSKTLPNPLRLNNGTLVKTPAQWAQRRPQVLATVTRYFIGTMPPAPGNLVVVQLDEKKLKAGVTYRRVRLSFGPQHAAGFNVALFIPPGKGPFATIVHPIFYPTPGDDVSNVGKQKIADPKYADPQNAAELYTDALGRGYAILTYNYQQIAADHADDRNTGVFRVYHGYSWGALGAWAWSMSRCVDYLENQPFADHSRILAVGHSRLGKTTLIAGALDTRFALVAPAGSGCGGTGAFRYCGPGRGGKEGIESYCKHFPYQLTPAFLPFANHVYELPFDQNWLIALCAPRPFIAADSYNDQWCNSNALKKSIAGARPVYDLLGADKNLAVHFRHGPHALAPQDWKAILDFADARLHYGS